MLFDITNDPLFLRPRTKKPIDETKYKTELCRNWIEHGFCNYGNKCNFAHGRDELNQKIPCSNKYKSKQCQPFHTKGYCTYGQRCMFVHEARALDELSRKIQTILNYNQSRPARTSRLQVFRHFAEDRDEEQAELISKDATNYLERIMAYDTMDSEVDLELLD
jgi:hypothetical protein